VQELRIIPVSELKFSLKKFHSRLKKEIINSLSEGAAFFPN